MCSSYNRGACSQDKIIKIERENMKLFFGIDYNEKESEMKYYMLIRNIKKYLSQLLCNNENIN